MRSLPLMLIAAAGLLSCATSEPVRTSAGPPAQATTARRADLAPDVARFVDEVAALEPAEYNTGLTDVPATERGLIPGWNDKVCPQVTGLPASEGEFILGRISQIARAAVVPMAGEHCSPNLFIFVTAGPTQLLRSMEKTSSAFTFGPHALPTVLDQFIATPRPVRAWYNIGVGGAVMPFKFAFSRVTVIVDQTRLLGVSRGQLADYVALVGLTEVRPAAHLGDAPTILKLFAGMPQAAPAGLTDWDQAFLKSVYSTATWPQAWKRRQDQLASSMVLQIVP